MDTDNEANLFGTEEKSKDYRGTQTPEGMLLEHFLNKPYQKITIEEVAKELEEYLPKTTDALKLVLATSLAGVFDNPVMIWLLLVGVPSSGKTEVVKFFKKSPFTYYLDNVTLNAFISGERESEHAKVYDLLPQLNKKCFIIKDWTSMFSLDERMTKKIIGDMVNAYDRTMSKFSSRRGKVEYNTDFSQIGCITPATLNKHTTYLNMVGARFLNYIVPDTNFDDEERSFKAIFNKDNKYNRDEIFKHLQTNILNIYHYLLQCIYYKEIDILPFKDGPINFLKKASRFMAHARGILIIQSATFKDEEGKDIQYYEPLDVQIEKPWRAVQQLMTLSKYLAIVNNHNEVGIEELVLIKDVVMSSMPADRAQALRTLREAPNGELTAKELSDDIDKSVKTARRLLDELTFLGIVDKDKGVGTISTTYRINELYKDFVLLHPREFMSSYSDVVEAGKEIFK